MLIGLVFYYLVEFSERFLIPWHISVRSDACPLCLIPTPETPS